MAMAMTRTFQLFSLQYDCLMNIFMFLELKEIGRIDTCTTNRRNRETLLAVLKTLTRKKANLSQTASCAMFVGLRYLLLRDIIVKEVKFHPSSTEVDFALCAGQLSIQPLRGLISVKLTGNRLQSFSISDAVLTFLVAGCRGLISVDLEDCVNITDAGLAILAGGCAGLTSVKLHGCDNITNAGLAILEEMGCEVKK